MKCAYSKIDEKKVCKLITRSKTDIVNLFDNYIQWTNGYMMLNFNYDNCAIISKLFTVGALTNYKSLTPKRTLNLEQILKCEKEVEAIKTPFMKEYAFGNCYAFKINGKYHFYNKKFIDVFQNMEYKAAYVEKYPESPRLKIYDGENLVGYIMPVRNDNEEDQIILKELEEGD